jgi:hypothetical protein
VRYSLLIYDGSVPAYVRVAERAADAWRRLRPVPWGDERVQSFLAAQFDATPFSFILVEADTVYAGRAAVERLLERLGAAGPIARLVRDAYPVVADPFGRVFHGRPPADLHGTFPLADAAATHLDSLRRPTEIPVREG